MAKLRRYVEQGGLIFGHADAASPHFAGGFRDLGRRLFPDPSFHPLSADDSILTAETFRRNTMVTPPPPPPLEQLDNGDRALRLLLPSGDLGRAWQVQGFPPAIKRYPVGQLMMDVYLYATEASRCRPRRDVPVPPPGRRPGRPHRAGRPAPLRRQLGFRTGRLADLMHEVAGPTWTFGPSTSAPAT